MRPDAPQSAPTDEAPVRAPGGLVVVLSGPSGVGKDAMLKRVLANEAEEAERILSVIPD